MIKDQSYSRTLESNPSSVSIIYAPGDVINGTVSGFQATITPTKTGKVVLKILIGLIPKILETHFVSNIGVTEIIAEEGLFSIQEASSIFVRWFNQFNKELFALTVDYGIGYTYSNVSISMQEYIEIGLLELIRISNFSSPKEFVSREGIKLLQSETERIEFFRESTFQQTIPEDLGNFAFEIAGLLVNNIQTVDLSGFVLRGNRRSEISERYKETLVPVGTIERIVE